MGNNAITNFARLSAIGLLAVFSVLSPAIAEEPQNEAAIRVTLLGTGTPAPNPRQFGASILVEVGKTYLLFDCGRGCAHRLWNLGHHYLRNTSHLFLTHMHSDHIVGVPDLYMNGWNFGRITNLRVYGPAGADRFMHHIRQAFEDDVVFRADRQLHAVSRETLEYIAVEMVDGKSVAIGDATVTAIKVDHHVVEPAFGYRIDAGGYSVVISGDTAYSENLVKQSAGADVVIHEVFSPALARFVQKTFSREIAEDIVALHTLAPDVGRVFSRIQPRLGVLTHLDNNPDKIPELADQIRSTWKGKFVVGEDLMTIEVGKELRVIKPGLRN